VDAAKAYEEVDIGVLPATQHEWNAPYRSDWAIAAGNFPDAPVSATPQWNNK
jgi:hypothetical protein